MFCGGCGVRVPEGAAYCPACGLEMDPSYGVKEKSGGLSNGQTFGITFLVSFLGSIPSVIIGLIAAAAAVLGILLADKRNEQLLGISLAGAVSGLVVGTALSILIFLALFGSVTGAFGLRRA